MFAHSLVFELWFFISANTVPVLNNLLFINNLTLLYKLKYCHSNQLGTIFRKKCGKLLDFV